MTDAEFLMKELARLDYIHNPRYNRLDDIAISTFFTDVYGDEYRFCSEGKSWYRYNPVNGVWREDITHTVNGKAMSLVRAMGEYGRRFLKEDTESEREYKRRFMKWVHSLGSHGARESFLKDANIRRQFSKRDLDSDRNLMNCLDGVFNLETGEILEHSPDYLFSKCSCVKLKGKKNGTRWNQFVQEITQNDAEVIEYLQKILGSCLCYGNPYEECYFIWGITTRNGKTTLLESVGHVFGDYAVTCSPDTFAVRRGSRDASKPEPDVAMLQGARFIRCPEPDRDMVLDVAKIKTFTGGNQITTRTLNEKPFSFRSESKIFFDVNWLPQINDLTAFSSKRLIVIPFDRKFEDGEQDHSLKQKLQSPDVTNAIFWWLWDGLKKFRTSDMTNRPERVEQATAQYEADSDKLKLFLTDCTTPDSSNLIPVKEAYNLFESWCTSSGKKSYSKQRFIQELKAKRMYVARKTIDGKQHRNLLAGVRWNDDIEQRCFDGNHRLIYNVNLE